MIAENNTKEDWRIRQKKQQAQRRRWNDLTQTTLNNLLLHCVIHDICGYAIHTQYSHHFFLFCFLFHGVFFSFVHWNSFNCSIKIKCVIISGMCKLDNFFRIVFITVRILRGREITNKKRTTNTFYIYKHHHMWGKKTMEKTILFNSFWIH